MIILKILLAYTEFSPFQMVLIISEKLSRRVLLLMGSGIASIWGHDAGAFSAPTLGRSQC